MSNGSCSVCAQAIPRGRLMCAAHWRQVPLAMQRDVWRTWKAFQDRDRQRSAFYGLRLLADYRQASDAATDHVKSLQPQTEITL